RKSPPSREWPGSRTKLRQAKGPDVSPKRARVFLVPSVWCAGWLTAGQNRKWSIFGLELKLMGTELPREISPLLARILLFQSAGWPKPHTTITSHQGDTSKWGFLQG